MPINTTELVNIVSELVENRNIRVRLKESVKGGVIAGITTTVGGIILGPGGVLAGM